MPTQVQPANQARPQSFKYTNSMRNPPTQNVAMVPSQTNVQAVHVKGKFDSSDSLVCATLEKNVVGQSLVFVDF